MKMAPDGFLSPPQRFDSWFAAHRPRGAARGQEMSEPAGEHERTMAFAEIAFGQIKALHQPTTPRNYEVWYTYATGYNPSLN